jgi:hypothetical protein
LETLEKNEEETMDVTMTNVDLGAGYKESKEVDQDTSRLMKDSYDDKDNSNGEHMDVTKSKEEVGNLTKERTVELIRITEKVDLYIG